MIVQFKTITLRSHYDFLFIYFSFFIGNLTYQESLKKSQSGMKISDISVDISPIYLISVMLDMISVMTNISLIYRF